MNPILSPGIDIVQPSGAYLLRDEFSVDVAAGSVNGTAAVPGPGTRTVNDTQGYLSIGAGNVTAATNGAGSWGNPRLVYSGISRSDGRMLIGKWSSFDADTNRHFGLSSSQTPGAYDVFSVAGGSFRTASRIESAGSGLDIGITINSGATILRTSGHVMFAKPTGGEWRLVWISSVNNSAILYPFFSIAGHVIATVSLDFIRVPVARWLPTPLVSDGFGSAFGTSDGLGHAEGVAGGIGAGGAGATWSNVGGTWSVSSGKAINTPSAGAEKQTDPGFEGAYAGGLNVSLASQLAITVSENTTDQRSGSKCQQAQASTANAGLYQNHEYLTLQENVWYRLSVYAKRIAGASGNCTNLVGSAGFAPSGSLHESLSGYALTNATYSERYRVLRCTNSSNFKLDFCLFSDAAIGDTVVFDDISIKPLVLSELMSNLAVATADIFASVSIAQSGLAFAAACPSGLVLSCDSVTNPQNFVVVYINRQVNTINEVIRVEKCVAGTWSSVSTTAYTYSAGARLVVVKNGTEYRTYYNNALIKADTITDAGIITNTYHGLFSTDPGNTFDDLCIYATGSSGEYNALNAF